MALNPGGWRRALERVSGRGIRGERWIQVALSAAILGMVLYLGFRHYRRIDLTSRGYYTLSDKTRAVLKTLVSELDILVFIDPNRSDLHDDVRNLLQEYAEASPLVRLQVISPLKNPARTEELLSRYDVSRLEDVVVFDYEGRQKYVYDYELGDFDYSDAAYGGARRLRTFRGEQTFTSAILALSLPGSEKVHFLDGHGERSIADFEDKGLSTLAKYLKRENLEPEPVTLATRESLPAECRLLVIPGPGVELPARDVSIIRDFLRRDGRLLLMTDPLRSTGLEGLMEEWGILVGNDIVIEPVVLAGLQAITTELMILSYPPHPITRRMADLVTNFSYARSVRPAERTAAEADRPRVSVLAETTPRGWAEKNLDARRARYDKGEDDPGPVPIAVAAEVAAIPDADVGATRIVVFGDSDFASNRMLTSANFDFLMGAVNWLLERESLIAIGPKDPQAFVLVLGARQMRNVFLVSVLGLPLAVLLVGGRIWWGRRR